MLTELPSATFEEWKEFERLEPFSLQRMDLQVAHLIWSLLNMVRRTPLAEPIETFLLQYEGSEAPPELEKEIEARKVKKAQDNIMNAMLQLMAIHGSNIVKLKES